MTFNLGGTIVEVEVPVPPIFQVTNPNTRVIEVFPVGGPLGPPGPPGPSGNTFRHVQASPSASWTITHNLGKHPSVVVVLDLEGHVYTDVTYINDNVLNLEFPVAVTGTADM